MRGLYFDTDQGMKTVFETTDEGKIGGAETDERTIEDNQTVIGIYGAGNDA